MNVLAIDQGTSATKALLVGPGGEVLGRGEVPVRTRSVGADGVEADPEELFGSVVAAGRQALAAARRAGPRGGAGQPGRDRAGLGPAHRCAADPGDRLAGPAVWRRVRAARGPFGRTDRDHRPAARPVLRRAEDDLAAGEPDRRRHRHHHRQLAAGPAGRRVRDRRRHRVPDPAARPGPRGLVARRPARPSAWTRRRCRRWPTAPGSVGETAAFGRLAAGGRDRRGPAGRAAGRGLPGRGRRQVHLRDGRVPAGHHRCSRGQVRRGAVRVGGLAAGRRGDILPGWAGLHGGFGAALADRASACCASPASSTRWAGPCRTRAA